MKYQKRRYWKYRVYEDEVFHTDVYPEKDLAISYQGHPMIALSKSGVLTCFKNYIWDGPSGPTIHTENSKTPSLAHDAFYQLMRTNLLDRKWRKRADEILYEMLRARRMWKFRAKIWYRAVRKAAGNASKYDVLTAP